MRDPTRFASSDGADLIWGAVEGWIHVFATSDMAEHDQEGNCADLAAGFRLAVEQVAAREFVASGSFNEAFHRPFALGVEHNFDLKPSSRHGGDVKHADVHEHGNFCPRERKKPQNNATRHEN